MNAISLILTLLRLKGWGQKKVYKYVTKCDFSYENCVEGLTDELNDNEKILFKEKLIITKAEIEKNLQLGIHACCILDKEFPKKLYAASDPCVFLYYKGEISLLSQKSITIIGTRKPDDEFIAKGKKITEYFSKKGYVIVSGLALGCDTIAHDTCLKYGGKTIAVLPSSCDNIQPSINRVLADSIVKNGGLLISEYSAGTVMSKYNYPQRDRIQSLLSTVTLIIQATDTSGTMIAAKKSMRDGKLVYAVSGNNLKTIQQYFDVDSTNDLKDIEKWIF